jgi:hypothetical protein
VLIANEGVLVSVVVSVAVAVVVSGSAEDSVRYSSLEVDSIVDSIVVSAAGVEVGGVGIALIPRLITSIYLIRVGPAVVSDSAGSD